MLAVIVMIVAVVVRIGVGEVEEAGKFVGAEKGEFVKGRSCRFARSVMSMRRMRTGGMASPGSFRTRSARMGRSWIRRWSERDVRRR